MKADLIRTKFLEFFAARKHRIVESDSLVPAGDPTVLFTPAGMNQFKREFMGYDSGFKRAATSQRCLRTDDLDKVGKTSAHHTFFEMLGNFSFGDYFKKEAIVYAWEFLTEVLKIDPRTLWVSVYKDDDEAFSIWRDVVHIASEKIVRLGDKDNFWPQEAKTKGPNGPCGPCSEIFFDLGKQVGCAKDDCTPACNCGRFIEIWNLVFTQFNRKDDGSLEPLPNKNIDTGMGLERITAVMQGVTNNFETDLFQPLIKEITLKSKLALDQSDVLKKNSYAIADHLRAIVFAIFDGVLPSNEERGYVIRKLIRKCVLHTRSLGVKQPLLYTLVPVLADIMKGAYPQLSAQREHIANIILSEEKNFIACLASSDKLCKEKFKAGQDSETTGRLAFELHDTYGIPLELTKNWLDKQKLPFSQQSFDQALMAQKLRSKTHSVMKGDVFSDAHQTLDVKETVFLGYNACVTKAAIVKLLVQGKDVARINERDGLAQLVLNKSVFYPESGGQVGDTGLIEKGKSCFEVIDTKKIDKAIVHIGRVTKGSFKRKDIVIANVNQARRLSIARNHTATHLLQAALRTVLGDHVRQEGSLVAEEKLRFDFTHFKNIDEGQLNRIEALVNGFILDNQSLSVKETTLALAKKTKALAFFGEKYGSK
nr:alanine--tRNA ligase [Candidatus Omnitrophota bacterium]